MKALANPALGVAVLFSTVLSGCSFTLFGQDCDNTPPGPQPTTSLTNTGMTSVETGETATITTTDDCPDDGEIASNDWLMVSSGDTHSCAVDADGMVSCWGESTSYESRPTGYDGYWTSVHTGSMFTCATESRDDGADYIKCWGDISAVGIDGLYEADNVSVGANHLCFVEEDSLVVCSGDDSFGQSTPPKDLRADLVKAGPTASCALDVKASRLDCWGSVGATSKTKKTTKSTTSTTSITTTTSAGALTIKGKGFSTFDVGDSEVCVLASEGDVLCHDLVSGDAIATNIAVNEDWSFVTMGTGLGCVFDESYNSACWSGKKELTFTMGSDVVDLSAGNGFACAIEDVWGVSTATTTETTTETSGTSKSKGSEAGGTIEETGIDLVLLGNDLVCWGDSESGAACPP